MGDNPVTTVDPEGDEVITGMIIGAAVGVIGNGITNLIAGNQFFDNWQTATLMGAIGGGIAGAGSGVGAGILDASMSVASSYLPSANIPIGEHMTLSLSPAMVFGSQGFSVGASVGLNVGGEGFNAGINVSGGVTDMEMGSNSVKGWIGSIGGGMVWGSSDGNSFGFYTNKTFGAGIGQQVGGITGSYKGFSATYENDGGPPFSESSGPIGALNDKGDRWRTNAVSLGYGGVDVRLNMFTGQAVSTDFSNPEYPNGVHNPLGANDYRLGALSLGFNGYRIGWNSERIRHLFQNKFAHTHTA